MQDDSQPTLIPSHMNAEDFIRQLMQEIAHKDQEIEKLTNDVATLKEVVQQLKDEVAVLKGVNPKPKIPPSGLEGRNKPKKGSASGSSSNPEDADDPSKQSKPGQPKGTPRNKKEANLTVHEERVIHPLNLSEGAAFKGYNSYLVQDIVFQAYNTRYLLARWQLPDGTYVTGALPPGVDGHYGPELKAYILHQVHACRVTEGLLLEQLHERGILISAGQLSNILINGAKALKQEADTLLQAGVTACNQVQVDDTGGRHKGNNQYTTVIGNRWFSLFTTTESKSRINFLKLLQGGDDTYLINQDAVDYLAAANAPSYMPGYIALSQGERFTSLTSWEEFLRARNLVSDREVRLVTEAALCASIIEKGIPRDLGIHADDAGQFDVALFIGSLCWIHEERHYRKLIMTTDQAKADLERVMEQIWELYGKLKAYKLDPSETESVVIENLFEQVFTQKTSSKILNDRLAKTYQEKEELLRVLKRPETPLHNNMSETDARAAKIKLNVSGGTRSEAGKQARDTLLSLKQTCMKLGIRFSAFLKDRIGKLGEIPSLAEIIRQRSASPPGLVDEAAALA